MSTTHQQSHHPKYRLDEAPAHGERVLAEGRIVAKVATAEQDTGYDPEQSQLARRKRHRATAEPTAVPPSTHVPTRTHRLLTPLVDVTIAAAHGDDTNGQLCHKPLTTPASRGGAAHCVTRSHA